MKISPRLVAMAQTYRDRAIGYRDLAIRMAQTHRRTAMAVGAVLSIFLLLTVATTIWFVVGVVRAMPDRAALRSIGTMVQATTVLDAKDQQAFTIFREQRIDVPLERVSRSLVAAIIAIEDQRFY